MHDFFFLIFLTPTDLILGFNCYFFRSQSVFVTFQNTKILNFAVLSHAVRVKNEPFSGGAYLQRPPPGVAPQIISLKTNFQLQSITVYAIQTKNINRTFKNYFEPFLSKQFAHKGEIRSLKTPQLQTGKENLTRVFRHVIPKDNSGWNYPHLPGKEQNSQLPIVLNCA